MQPGILTEAEHKRIAEAIHHAEQSTSGEIYCVLARRSDSYFFAAAFAVTVAVMIASLVAAALLDYFWVVVHPLVLVAAQVAAFGATLVLLRLFPGLAIHLVPRSVCWRRAHANAVAQFLARNIHSTENRTGVLLFVSMAERYAEVVADSGINARVKQEKWNAVVELLVANAGAGRLAAGFEAAIAEVGAMLAGEFPRLEGDRNELEDHVAEM